MNIFLLLRKQSLLCVFALVAALAAEVPPARYASGTRLVAVGDVHGDFDALVSILQQADLIDAQHRWAGRNSIFVQTGDFLDRGPKSRRVMDLLMALESQAPKEKGHVVILLGNHEVMNLYGNLRYVTGDDYASFVDEKSENRRREAYQAHTELSRERARRLNRPLPEPTPDSERQWMEEHPPGFVEHRAAFGPQGKYGRWLRTKAPVFEANGTIFLHGGISPSLAETKIARINEQVKREIEAFDVYLKYLVEQKLALPFYTLAELTVLGVPDLLETQHLKVLQGIGEMGNWLTIQPNGPLWFRGFAQWTDEEGARSTAELERAYGAVRFVVGHTVQPEGRIRARFGGRVFLIDTGMLSSYFRGGRASALEIAAGKFKAIYTDRQEVLLDGSIR